MLIDSRIQLIGALLQYTGASAIFEEQVQHCHLEKKEKIMDSERENWKSHGMAWRKITWFP